MEALRRSSANKRKLDEDGTRFSNSSIASSRASASVDGFDCRDLDSQELHVVLNDIEEASEQSTQSGKASYPQFGSHRDSPRTSDPQDIAHKFDFGSQKPWPATTKQTAQTQRQVDAFFKPIKPGMDMARLRARERLKKEVDGETTQSLAPEDTAEVFRQPPSPQAAGPLITVEHAQSHLVRERPSKPRIKPHLEAPKSRKPLAPQLTATTATGTISTESSALLNPAFTKSFGASTVGSTDTSFTSVFSKERGFNAANPGHSAQTSFSSSPSSQDRAENFRVRNFPNKGLYAKPLPPNLQAASPRVKFECLRLLHAYNLPTDTLCDLQAGVTEDYDRLWESLSALNVHRVTGIPRVSVRAWKDAAAGSAAVCRSASLVYRQKNPDDLFALRINPLEVESSCRFFRVFGAHRFLKLALPATSRLDLPQYISGEAFNLQARLRQWLNMPDKDFMGYKWSVFCTKPHKDKRRKVAGKTSQDTDSRGCDVFLFATHGEGLTKVSIEQLIDWFLPLGLNGSAMACKAYSRFELGLSKTIPTLRFKPSQVKEVGDCQADGSPEASIFNDRRLAWPTAGDIEKHAIMNDGCSLLSVAAAAQIWSLLGEKGTCPSAFQARIGPWKGVWMIAPVPSDQRKAADIWIEVTPSQRKFVRHVEDLHDTTFEAERLTFEVLSYSRMPKESFLYLDYLPLLEDRGVDREVMAQVVRQNMDSKKGDLDFAVGSVTSLYRWIEQNFAKDGDNYVVSDDPTLPKWLSDRISALFDAGFNFEESSYLQGLIKVLAKTYFRKAAGDLKVPVARSTSVLGVADPLGVLEPGEVHLAFSGSFGDTGAIFLHDMEVLVGRHPALRRSDIQKVKAVFKFELQHLRDVIVFPSKGQVPLAAKLQGGDYDGDKFWVCWDPDIAGPFRNAPAPIVALRPEEVGIAVERRTLVDLISWNAPRPLGRFFEVVFDFAMQPPILGVATNLHTNISYNQNRISSPGIDCLADLHDLLVDTAKNGYLFSWSQWDAFKRSLPEMKPSDMRAPLYKSYERNVNSFRRPSTHIVDHMIFNVAAPYADSIIKVIEKLNTGAKLADDDVSTLAKQGGASKDAAVSKTLADFFRQIDQLYLKYRDCRKAELHKPSSGFEMPSSQADKIDINTRALYQAIAPPQEYRDELESRGWFRKAFDAEPSHWEKVRASALFSVISVSMPWGWSDDFVFACDFSNICYLKAFRSGAGRPALVSGKIYSNLRMRKVRTGDESKSFTSFEAIDDNDDGGDTEIDESDTEAGQEEFHEAFEDLTQDVADSTIHTPRKKRRS